jgi:acetyltransferase
MLESMPKSQADDRCKTRSGRPVTIRPIQGDDEERMRRFHRALSPESVYTRYFNVLKLSERIAHERLDRVCHPLASNETVLVVETDELNTAESQIIGVGRLSVTVGSRIGELAIVVSDANQRQGIGAELLHRLFDAAKQRNLRHISAHILCANLAMQRLCLRAGMRLVERPNSDEVTAEFDLPDDC